MVLLVQQRFSLENQTAGRVRAAVRDAIAELHAPESIVNDLLTASSELIANLRAHPIRKPREVHLNIDLADVDITVELLDDGSPFTDFAARVAAADRNLLETSLVEHGLGLYLVRSMFDDIGYEAGPDGGWNRFWGTKALRQRGDRIMVVDDDPTSLALYLRHLRPTYRVMTCESAEEALANIESFKPHLLLCDINLPGMNGFELVNQIRAMDGMPAIVFLTGDAKAQTRHQAIALGIDDYIVKPFRRNALLDVVQRVLIRARHDMTHLARLNHRQLSHTLAPELPARIGPWATAVGHMAPSAGGGDLLFAVPSGRATTILMADVMGHGVGAKIMAHTYAGYLYGLARSVSAEAGPAALLASLSELVARDAMLQDWIITAVAVRIEPEGTLIVAGAGHPLPFLVRQERFISIEACGPLLGLMKDAQYSELRIEPRPGDRLVLYTDGLLPTASPTHTMRGIPIEMLSITAQRGLDLPEIVRRVLSCYQAIHGLQGLDDVTVALIDFLLDAQP